jgi:hypothetical protein
MRSCAEMTAVGRAWASRRTGPPLASWSLVLCVLAAAGCSGLASSPGGSFGPEATVKAIDRIHQQAQDALDRWARAVDESGGAKITFTGDLTSQIGTWEAAIGDNNKEALQAGKVVAATALPTDRQARGKVKWVDGNEQDVNVLSAADALADLVADASGTCAGCHPQPLRVTGANLATSLAETSRGPAEVPTWVYTIAGTSVRVTRVAVDKSITVHPPAWNANDPPQGISIEGATGDAASTKLTVSFVGAPDRRDKPCGADYTAEAVESDLAVVVIVKEDRNPASGGCDLVGAVRTATVRMAAPLGTRTVLEVREGLPVPVSPPS